MAALSYKHGALTLDAEFSYEGGGFSRDSATTSSSAAYQRKLDLRATWKQSARQEWRIALSDVLHPDRSTLYRYEGSDAGAWQQSAVTTHGGATLRLNYKHDFN
jgi:hypothetical protein